MEVTVLARMPSCLSATGTGWELIAMARDSAGGMGL